MGNVHIPWTCKAVKILSRSEWTKKVKVNGHTKLAVTTSPSPNIDVAERTYANLLEEQILQYNQQTIVGPCLPFCALVQQQQVKKNKNNVCVLCKWTTKKDILQWFCWQKHERRLKITMFKECRAGVLPKTLPQNTRKILPALSYNTLYTYVHIYIQHTTFFISPSSLHFWSFNPFQLPFFFRLWSITWRRRHWHWAVWNDPHCHALCIAHRSCPGNRGGFFSTCSLIKTGWWLNQLIWKMCAVVKIWIISPGFGVKITNVWNHHLEKDGNNGLRATKNTDHR